MARSRFRSFRSSKTSTSHRYLSSIDHHAEHQPQTSLYIDGRFTFDLHDLAAIILRERQLSDNRFKHTRLREVCVGGTTLLAFPAHGQTIWTSIPAPNKVAYFLKEQPTVDGIANHPLELSEFLDPELRLPPGRAPLSEKEKELLFWRYDIMTAATSSAMPCNMSLTPCLWTGQSFASVHHRATP